MPDFDGLTWNTWDLVLYIFMWVGSNNITAMGLSILLKAEMPKLR